MRLRATLAAAFFIPLVLGLTAATAHARAVESIAFSPDGRLLATGGSDTDVWEVETGERVRELAGFPGGPNGVMFTPDGKTLLIAGAGKLRVWDLGTGRERSPAAEAVRDEKDDGGEFR